MTYELNENITLKYIGGYRDVTEDRIYDYDGSAALSLHLKDGMFMIKQAMNSNLMVHLLMLN